jgi:hypothetical protein
MKCYNCKENSGLLYYSSEDFENTTNDVLVCSRLCYIKVYEKNRNIYLLTKVLALLIFNSILLLLIFLYQINPIYFFGEALINLYLLSLIFSLRKFETSVFNLDQDLFNDYKDRDYQSLKNKIKVNTLPQRFSFRSKQYYLIYGNFCLVIVLALSLDLFAQSFRTLSMTLILLTSFNFILFVLIISQDFIDYSYIQTEHALAFSMAFILMQYYLIKLELLIGSETHQYLSDVFFLPLITCYVLYFWYLRSWRRTIKSPSFLSKS